MTITNPNPNRCPEVGDIYNLQDVCLGHNVDATFQLLDNLVEAACKLPRWLHFNIQDEMSFVIHTFMVPYYMAMETFFNLPEGTFFSKDNDAPFECKIVRLNQTIEIEAISDDFVRPEKGVDLKELLDSANIDGRAN